MHDMKIRAGSRLTFTVKRADSEAVSATFIAQNDIKTIQDTVDYDSNGIAYFEIIDTDVVGEYDYQINENFEEGLPDIYPNMDDCDGDCDLPTLEICKSLPEVS